MTRLFRLIVLSLLGLAATAQQSLAADPYPTRPIKWIVPYPPAGTTDVLTRIIAQRLTEKLGQSVAETAKWEKVIISSGAKVE